MLRVYPTRSNVIYKEWKKWFYRLEENFSSVALEAKHSIEEIAEAEFPEGNVVAHMITMKDTEEMEAEKGE